LALRRNDLLGLVLEVLAGIVGYVAGAFWFARRPTRDFLGLARRFMRRDPQDDDDDDDDAAAPTAEREPGA
jgi:hypothetical protein